jgi:PST family polysaccharide transporter
LLGLLLGALVARHLGAEAYGRLAFALAFVALLAPFLSAGDGIAVRDLEAGAAPPETVLGNTALLTAAATVSGAGLMLVAGWIFPQFMPPETRVLVLIVLVGPLCRPLGIVDYWFQWRLDARRASMARNASFLVGAVARIVALAVGGGVVSFAVIVSCEAMLSTALLVIAYHRSGGMLRAWAIHLGHLRLLTRQASALVLAGLSVALYMRIDQVMLGSLSGVDQSGLYAVAVLLSEVTWFVPVAALVTLTPTMTRLWADDKAAYERRLQSLFTAAAGASYVIVALSLLVGFWAIPLLYGREFEATFPVFAVLTLATPFVFLGVTQSVWTINAERQGIALARTGVAAVLNVLANLFVLPRWGAQGAAYTTLLSYAIAALFANAFFAPTRPIARMQLRALALGGAPTAWRERGQLMGGEA